jgi:hypothetical protein
MVSSVRFISAIISRTVVELLCMAESTSTSVEQEIVALEQQLAAKRAELGQDTTLPYERAEVHAALGEQIQTQAPAYVPPTPSVAPSGETPSWQDPALSSTVQELVTTAFTQGVQAAITKAIQSGNPALVDALHDVLADELHAQLIERGKLEAAA